MIYQAKTNYVSYQNRPFIMTPGLIPEAGMGAVSSFVGGVRTAKISGGETAGFFPEGLIVVEKIKPQAVPRVDPFVVGSGGIIALPRVPLAPSVDAFLTVNGVRLTYSASDPGADLTKFSITNATVRVAAAHAGKSGVILYRTPTLAEDVMNFIGEGFESALTSYEALGNISLCIKGDVALDTFSMGDDWAGWKNPDATPIKLGANGMLTLSGDGIPTRWEVEELPTESVPFLVVRL